MNKNDRMTRRASAKYQEVATTSTWIARLAVVGATIAYFLVVAQWGWHLLPEDHAEAAEPPIQSTSGAPPVSVLRMGPISTGVVAVDDAVRGFLNGDAAEAFSHLVAQQVRCGTLPSQGTPALKCIAGEAPGTAHDLILSACEPKWMTGEEARAELTTLLADTPGLYAAFQVSGGYTALLAWPDASDRSLLLSISSVGVTAYGTGCGLPFAPSDGHELSLLAASAR